MTARREGKRLAFYWVGRLEAASFIALLGIAMPLKYAAGMPEAVRWVGWAHGLLFIVYLFGLLSVARAFKLGFGQVILGGVAACVPFGPVWLEHRWRKQAVLGE